MPHPFIVGERYLDRKGEYTVIRIDGGRLIYQYDDGVELAAGVEIKARIFQNILAERRGAHPYQSKEYFWSIGYLSRHGDFQAEVPPQSQPNFEHHYYLVTGVRPQLHKDGYYPIQVQDPNEKWGPELRIYFPDPLKQIDLPAGVELRQGNAPDILRINNNSFWWHLIRAGFRLGTVHDVARIKQSIPAQFYADFDAGRV